jgi:exodeoxyribonuclease V alpha subunit
VGIVLESRDGQLRVWFDGGNGLRAFLPSALPAHDTVYAMTIHKSQGSEFDAATRVLPDYDLLVLTTESFYPGLTRTRERLAVLVPHEALQRAVGRKVARVSGLASLIVIGD